MTLRKVGPCLGTTRGVHHLQKSTRAIDRNGKSNSFILSASFASIPAPFPPPLSRPKNVSERLFDPSIELGESHFFPPPRQCHSIRGGGGGGSSRLVLWNSFSHSFSIDRSNCVETVLTLRYSLGRRIDQLLPACHNMKTCLRHKKTTRPFRDVRYM